MIRLTRRPIQINALIMHKKMCTCPGFCALSGPLCRCSGPGPDRIVTPVKIFFNFWLELPQARCSSQVLLEEMSLRRMSSAERLSVHTPSRPKGGLAYERTPQQRQWRHLCRNWTMMRLLCAALNLYFLLRFKHQISSIGCDYSKDKPTFDILQLSTSLLSQTFTISAIN